MKRIFLILIFANLVSCTSKEAAIPDYIVGVWTTDNSKLKGELVFEGHGFYIDKYGTGAIIGGPPPIGFEVNASFDKNSNLLSYQATKNSEISGQYKYDKESKQLVPQKGISNPLSKRHTEFTKSTKKALGL